MSTPTNGLLLAALDYAARGWPVIPLHTVAGGLCSCGKRDCGSPGKHPQTSHGLKDASTDPTTIAGWWQTWPAANVGIVTGVAAGIVAVDIDPRHGGNESLAALEAEQGELPATVEALTGGGGRHFLFQHPGGKVGNRSNVRPGLDERGDGGYIVAAPSLHASGGRYSWRHGHTPGDIEPAQLPVWLHDLLTHPESAPRLAAPAARNGEALAKLLSAAGRYVAQATPASDGTRNNAAFSLAGHLAVFVSDDGLQLTEPQLVDLMRPWNHRNAPPLAETELVQAVRSAMKNGTPREAHTVVTRSRKTDKTAAAIAGLIEPFRPFPIDALPNPMREYVEAVAAATGTDHAYAALATLVVADGSIGNRAAALVRPGWVEPAVLWGALVGRSGTVKTHVLKLVAQPLVELYKRERSAFAEQQAEYNREVEHYAIRLAEWKQSQRKGPPTDPPDKPAQPIERRILVNDITIEKLCTLLEQNPLGLLVVRDELAAWVGAFDRYAGGGKGSDQPTWLSMYDAGPITVDRKSTGTSFIERAAVSVLGTIQPGTLSRVFGVSERESGLLARVLLVYPPEKPALWTEAALSEAAVCQWRDLIIALQALPAGIDELGEPRPQLIPFAADAKKLWIRWHDRHARELAEMHGTDLVSHYAKLKGGCARFALLFACTEVAAGAIAVKSISADHVSRAIQLTEWFKHEAARVYGILAESDEQRDARGLVEWIQRRGGSVSVRELTHGLRRFRDDGDGARNALHELVQAGLARWTYPTGPGRPTERLELMTDVAVTKTSAINGENLGIGDGDGDASDAAEWGIL